MCLTSPCPLRARRYLDRNFGSTSQRAYKGAVICLNANCIYFLISLAVNHALSPITRTVLLNALAAMIMFIIFQSCEYAFDGDDELIAMVYPSVFLGVELSNAVIFLGTSLTDPQFYVIVMLQEVRTFSLWTTRTV